jgi:hypothetical protein
MISAITANPAPVIRTMTVKLPCDIRIRFTLASPAHPECTIEERIPGTTARAFSIHLLTSLGSCRWQFLGEIATRHLAFCKEQNRKRCSGLMLQSRPGMRLSWYIHPVNEVFLAYCCVAFASASATETYTFIQQARIARRDLELLEAKRRLPVVVTSPYSTW